MSSRHSDSLTELIAACQAGDRTAQRALFDRFECRVYRIAWRMVGEHDAADLTQQTFLRVLETISQFRSHSAFETWLYRVATNECLQHIRRNSRARVHSLSREPVHSGAAGPARIELTDILDEALKRLESELRSILVLRELEHLNYAQLATVLGISEGTVASRLNRARRHLKQRLLELGWEPTR